MTCAWFGFRVFLVSPDTQAPVATLSFLPYGEQRSTVVVRRYVLGDGMKGFRPREWRKGLLPGEVVPYVASRWVSTHCQGPPPKGQVTTPPGSPFDDLMALVPPPLPSIVQSQKCNQKPVNLNRGYSVRVVAFAHVAAC